MTATHKNFLKTTISAVASAGLGALTISTASSGYRTFGAGDDGLTFDGISIVEGTAWEVRDGCVYTHSGTSLSRGTLQDSSTGSAITFTSAAVVSQNPSAGLAGRIEQVALVRATGGDSSITLAPNTHYTWDLSTLTADRTGTLPTTAAVGDAIEISAITSNASYELLLSTGSGQTCALGGRVVAASTEITRLLMAGETMRFVYEATNKWSVAHDGRIPQQCDMQLTTSADGEAVNTFTRPTQAATPGAWTAQIDNASLSTPASDRITARRSGNFDCFATGRTKDAPADGAYFNVGLYKNAGATLVLLAQAQSAGGGAAPLCGNARLLPLAAGDYLVFQFRNQAGSIGLLQDQSWFSIKEVL